MSALTLKIVTPEGVDHSIDCDSVSLWMAPDSKGKGEGSLGIRKDHVNAVIALGNGPVTAQLQGNTVFSAQSEGGFATVMNNVITVVSQQMTVKN